MMKKLFLLTLMALTSLTITHKASAQMGWTLNHCHSYFGHQFQQVEDDRGPGYWFPGHLAKDVYVTLDPDGTVGFVLWEKWDGSPFHEVEIQNLLPFVSNIQWLRTENPDGHLHWTGVQNGKAIFEAVEYEHRGTWQLAINTL
jgi:hypothetical protein